MTNTKNTKRALLSSVLALFLCFAMLLGTTYAWFTDSVTSAGNIIQSGTLDVEMEWKDATATGAQQTYKDASEGAIFNYDKWEPGYVEAKNIKISNVGTLALQYNLHIAANGEVSKLADVIDVYYAEGEYTLATREMTELTKIGTLSDVLDGMPANMTGDLEAGKNDIVTIALKMQEDAGNDYQGLSIGTNFSVILMATQDNVEKDAFDENYDNIEIPDKDVQVIEGNIYHYTVDGNVVLASVPYGNVGASFTVPDDVTILGQGDVYDGAVPVFSKSSPIESITLPEGLVEIKARAITGVKTLASINFPSTLKAIRAQALRQTGMDELTVPANVEVIGEGAFRDMANLTTVTVEGNVAFDNNAFRSCPNLTSIYLLGDDVTFTDGQFATHTDAGDATGITIYVKNTTVAARVYAAQTSAYGYEVKVLGEAADGSDAVSVTQVKNATDLDTSVANGGNAFLTDDLTFSANNTTANSGYGATGVSVNGGVLDGNGKTLTVNDAWTTWDCAVNVKGGTIKNLTINSAMRGIFMGSATADVYIDNVTIDGTVYTFNSDGGSKDYGVYISNSTLNGWTSHSDVHKEVVYTNCNFGEGSGYAYCRPYGPTTFKNCAFEAGFTVEALGQVTFENCTIGGVALTADNLATLVTSGTIANATVK